MITGGYIMANMIGNYSIENVPEIRWRLPFILSGLLLGLTTFMLRLSMEEVVVKHKAQHATPLINVFRTQKKELLLTTLVVGLVATLTYSLNGFIPAYLQKVRGFSIKDALNLTSSYIYIMVVMIFISGFLCDYIQRKKIIMYTMLATFLLAPLIFYYIAYGDYSQIKNALILFSCLLGFMSGGIPSFLASAFYDSQRYSGSTFAYNFGMACFGGFTPWLMFKLSTINDILPGIVISVFAFFVFFVIFFDKAITSKWCIDEQSRAVSV
jgi:MHS family proline/betaine transporter-like MFS transporter